MANQKTSDLRRITPGQLAPGDLFPVVDVSEPTSPTGENKTITAQEWAQYVHDNYTPPGSRFTLTFRINTSQLLMSGSSSDVLPANYVLTTAVLESSQRPLISIGTSNNTPPVSASITGSWTDNRVYITSCSYDVNYLEVSNYGAVHHQRSIWVQFHNGTDCPCTLSFDGYTL